MLVAAVAFLTSASTASATWWNWGNDITVTNNNSATVTNTVGVVANTGANVAAGGDGGSGGSSGYTKASGGSTATGGDANGGNGGSNSGNILTGDATAKAYVTNDVNYNRTKVTVDCECSSNVDDVKVKNTNGASVGNDVGVLADTGYNDTLGGLGGDGGTTGKTKAYSSSVAVGGDANGGSGATNSGDIDTGSSYAKAKVTNTVNTNITRVRR